MARQGADGMAQSEARDRAPLHLHLSLFLSFSLFVAGGDGAVRCRGDGKAGNLKSLKRLLYAWGWGKIIDNSLK